MQVSVHVMSALAWAPVGHEISFEQALVASSSSGFTIVPSRCPSQGVGRPGARMPADVALEISKEASTADRHDNLEAAGASASTSHALKAVVRKDGVVVEGPDALRIEWDCKEAALVSYRKGGIEFIGADGEASSSPNAHGESKSVRQFFWRAHTDNDNGGPDTLARFGATKQMYPAHCGFDKPTPRVRGAMAFGLWWMDMWGDSSFGRMWDKKGLARLRTAGSKVEVLQVQEEGGPGLLGDRASISIRCSYTLVADGTSTKIPCESVYVVDVDGSIVVRNTCKVSPDMPPMPRIGMQLTLKKQFQQLTYYGRGPNENYPDRCSGSKLGRYQCQVDDTYV